MCLSPFWVILGENQDIGMRLRITELEGGLCPQSQVMSPGQLV